MQNPRHQHKPDNSAVTQATPLACRFPHLRSGAPSRKIPDAETARCMQQVALDALALIFSTEQQD